MTEESIYSPNCSEPEASQVEEAPLLTNIEIIAPVTAPNEDGPPSPQGADGLPPGMNLMEMVNFVEQQIGSAERQLEEMAKPKQLKTELTVLGDGTHATRKSASGEWKPLDIVGMPKVYGNTQTGYRSDIRTGADIRGVMNCHQCKSNKQADDIVFCGHISIDSKGYSTTCTKRYCRTCLWNWYMEQAPKNDAENEPDWSTYRCPCCRRLCCCHRCRTFKKLQRGLDPIDLEERAGALSPARCLSRLLAETGFPHYEGDDEPEEVERISINGGITRSMEPTRRSERVPVPKRVSVDDVFAPIAIADLEDTTHGDPDYVPGRNGRRKRRGARFNGSPKRRRRMSRSG